MVWKLDRLGRNLRHLITTVDDLRGRGVGFRVLTGAGAQIDTTTANGRLFFRVFAAFAEFERELIIERTRAGLAAARARGRKGGRPRKMDQATLKAVQALLANINETAQAIAKRFGMGTVTLYTYLNGNGSLKEAGAKLMAGERAMERE